MKRKLPPSEVLSADKDNTYKMPRSPLTRDTVRRPYADECNAQREKPVYDVFRKRNIER